MRRAALARMNCGMGVLDEGYRRETAAADARGREEARNPASRPGTGNAFADNVFGVIGQGLQVVQSYGEGRGWGGDC